MLENNPLNAAGAKHRNLTPGSASAAVDFGRFGALRSAANGPDQAAALAEVAKEFEAVFLGMMLKSARAAMPQSGLLNSSRMDMFKDMFDQQIALTMAEQGALGIADAISRQMRPPTAPDAVSPDMNALSKGRTPLASRAAPSTSTVHGIADRGERAERISDNAAQATASSASADVPRPFAEFMPMNTHRPGAVRPGHAPFSAAGPTGVRFDRDGVADPFAAHAFKDAAVTERGKVWPDTRQGMFLNQIWHAVTRTAHALGVPPEAIAAQAALETGWGGHVMLNDKGRSSHNLFGVKAGSGWQGSTVDVQTHEVIGGRMLRVRDTFRAYPSIEHALFDYQQLLMRPRYEAVRGQTDAQGFGQALSAAGYATDPDYAEKISTIAAQIAAQMSTMEGRLQSSAQSRAPGR